MTTQNELIMKDENIHTERPKNLASSLLHCEICGQKFLKKKDLRSHINSHLGQPRVVLRRIPNLKSVKKKQQDDKYWLDPDKKGTLKLTLKKQCSSDSLKLTLKKSSISQDFTVINSNLDCESEIYKKPEVEGRKENDTKDDEEVEKSINEPFENVMLNQQEDYDAAKFDAETRNPLEDTERVSLDTNEGDSGVGSDMANPSEREDQNVDDLQSGDHDDNLEKTVMESEDPEESDDLAESCRETIENLKKLGEHSSSRSEISDKITEREEEGAECSTNLMHSLQSKPEISLVPKSSIMADPARSSTEDGEMDKNHEQSSGNLTYSWNQITTEENDKQNEKNEESREPTADGNQENGGTLLQSFLMDHQRRNQNETALSNNIPPFETEYVSLERLAETVNTCRVCNEKFKDMAQLDAHKSKMGHYQCNIPECGNLIFNNLMEVSIHKMQVHGAQMSPNMNQMSPHMSANSPHLNQNSPYMNQTSPHLNQTSPHMNQNSPQLNRNSPHIAVDTQGGVNHQMTVSSPHQTNSPSYNAAPNNSQQMISPVNFEQLPAPVQQLAQQVQRMPLPQGQMPPSLPPGANTMIPGPNIYIQPPGRPPMYRVSTPQNMYAPHMPHMYPQYPPPNYPGSQMGVPQMHPQMPQQMPRSRYSTIVQAPRAPRIPQPQTMPRQRLKRPLQQPVQMQQQNNAAVNKQRRMDVLLPDRNEDADCHVIAQQKRNDGVPVIQNVQGAAAQANRSDSTIHLTDSITLSVRQPGSAPAQVQNAPGPSGNKPDAKAVANVLAARGITVTPAMQKGKQNAEQNKQSTQQQQQQQQQQRPLPSQNITALNLNSAISIIPASSQKKQQEQQAQFAVPQNKQGKQSNSEVERPPRPPTVDLTQDNIAPPPLVRRGRPPRAILTCQVCDKRFQNQEMLTQHMANHRSTSKLLHKCNLCPAQYPTAQALMTHKRTYHKEADTNLQNGGIELALPVVDLKSPHVVNRLSNLGIQSFIPLSQLSAQTGGYFGLPIVTIDGARNPNVCNLGALGATSILSLGPLKHLSNR